MTFLGWVNRHATLVRGLRFRPGPGGSVIPSTTPACSSWENAPMKTTGGAPRPGGSARSLLSIGSAGSILSIGSAGSILSIGSAGSILSIGSAGSILSIASVGSVGSLASALSIGSAVSAGSILSGFSRWSVRAWRSAGTTSPARRPGS